MAYEFVRTSTGIVLAVDAISGGNLEVVKLDVGADGAVSGPVSAGNPMPVMAPADLPVSVARTLPVSIAAALRVDSNTPLEVTNRSGTALQVESRAPTEDRNLDVVWPSSIGAGVGVNVDLSAPANGVRIGGGLSVIVRNPSTVTTLTLKYATKWNDGSTNRWAVRSVMTVSSNNGDGEEFLIDGPVLELGGRLILSNVTALGSGQGFTGRVAVSLF